MALSPLSAAALQLSPFSFVRAVTLVLATFWTIRGAVRIIGFAHNWETKLHGWGMSRRWMRRQMGVVVLRSTVLDPINLALSCVLLALWVGPSRGWFHMDEWRGAWSFAPAAAEEAPTPSEVGDPTEASAPAPGH